MKAAEAHIIKNNLHDAYVPLMPKISDTIQEWLNNVKSIYAVMNMSIGPLHVIFPQMMAHNISDMRATMDNCGLQYRIYFAHKPTKSPAFIRQAIKEKIGLDVASKNELISALSSGFKGEDIECTGVKNESFLELALRHNCLIVIDSLEELKRICQIKDKYEFTHCTKTLIRVSEVSFADRQHKSRHSRFGIVQRDLPQALEIYTNRSDLGFMGFHLHNDERESDIRSAQVENMLSLMENAYEQGFEPTLLNIGGGLRRISVKDYNEWSSFVTALSEALMEQRPSITWERYSYGMRLNDKGKVMGRGSVQGLIPAADFTKILQDIFSDNRIRGRSLGQVITENGFDVIVEPGHSLLDQCGISLFKITEIKDSRDGEKLVLVDGNMYNLAIPMREYLMDPLLLPQEVHSNADAFEGFIIGNLCREEDFLSKRKIRFSQKPCAGDIIAFINTAAYKMDFEDASPHLHTTGNKIVAYKKNNDWLYCNEEAYNPYDAGEIK